MIKGDTRSLAIADMVLLPRRILNPKPYIGLAYSQIGETLRGWAKVSMTLESPSLESPGKVEGTRTILRP